MQTKKSIHLSSLVQIFFFKNFLVIQGPTTQLFLRCPVTIQIEKKKSYLFFFFKSSCYENTWFRIVQNLLRGLASNFVNRLFLKGLGFRVLTNVNQNVELKIGYSHSIYYKINKNVELSVFKNTIIELKTPFKEMLGTVCADIKAKRIPDSYKAKGIVAKRENLKLKPGKKS